MDLGSFGQGRPPAEDTFDWFGRTIRVHPDLSDAAMLDQTDNLKTATDPQDDEEARGRAAMIALGEFLRSVVHPDDYAEFWQVGRKNRLTMDDFTNVAVEIIEAVTGHPTQRSSDSSDGPNATGRSSTGVSSSEAIQAGYEARGRSDCAQVVQMVRRHREAV